jgi:nucleotide-binding universal stress UspA family protein
MVDGPLLICYDGSDGARTALEAAVAAFDRPAVVACYWQPFADSSRSLAMNLLELVQDPAAINEREQASAQRVADEGAELAAAAGRAAEPVAVRTSRAIDEAIHHHAEELDAFAIVLGSRGRSGLGSVLLGDVAGDVVQLSSRPVFVVPSGPLARRRIADRDGDVDAVPTPRP